LTSSFVSCGVCEGVFDEFSMSFFFFFFFSFQIVGNFGVVNLAQLKGKSVAVKQLKEGSGNDAASVSDALKKHTKSLQEFVSF
jgi:hypothetical protein